MAALKPLAFQSELRNRQVTLIGHSSEVETHLIQGARITSLKDELAIRRHLYHYIHNAAQAQAIAMCLAFFFHQRTNFSTTGHEQLEKSKPIFDWVRKVFKRYVKRTEDQIGNQGNQTEPSGKTGGFHIPPAYLLDEVKSFPLAKVKPSEKSPQPI
ncbi:MAG: hypothetical protein Q9209_007159 [Squamulea sp. 1 TL-2023]